MSLSVSGGNGEEEAKTKTRHLKHCHQDSEGVHCASDADDVVGKMTVVVNEVLNKVDEQLLSFFGAETRIGHQDTEDGEEITAEF